MIDDLVLFLLLLILVILQEFFFFSLVDSFVILIILFIQFKVLAHRKVFILGERPSDLIRNMLIVNLHTLLLFIILARRSPWLRYLQVVHVVDPVGIQACSGVIDLGSFVWDYLLLLAVNWGTSLREAEWPFFLPISFFVLLIIVETVALSFLVSVLLLHVGAPTENWNTLLLRYSIFLLDITSHFLLFNGLTVL